ncbi:MAG: hypothetical protein JW779_10285 [Candidatus Thorarchaeota archaeon]|nr:hypothetical protein [Candidatus Thorarchaeota archaeon]
MKLSQERFDEACQFIKENARALDARLFEFHFENGEARFVLHELSKYQNDDGGFGHGIEPDFRLKESSPMATSVGIQYYLAVNDDAESNMIRSAIRYLESTYDSELGFWPATFENVNNEPHAPWWHFRGMVRPEGVEWANPSAELAGYLNRFSAFVSTDILKDVNHQVQTYLDEHKIIGSWLYNIMCWERAYKFFPELLKSIAKKTVTASFQNILPLSQERLGEIKIHWLAPHPDSILTQVAPDRVRSLLEQEITKQADDGGWWPTWQWGQYEETWPIAEREWAGKKTVECLVTLRDFGLIEGFE